jgi:hypothetical protein
VPVYRRILELSPDDVEAHNDLGLALHYLGDTDGALTQLRAGAAKDAEHQRIWLTLGFVSLQAGDAARRARRSSTPVISTPARASAGGEAPVGSDRVTLIGRPAFSRRPPASICRHVSRPGRATEASGACASIGTAEAAQVDRSASATV